MEIDKLLANMEIRNLIDDLRKIFNTKMFDSPISEPEHRFSIWMKNRFKDFKDCIKTLIPGKPMKFYRKSVFRDWYIFELREDTDSDFQLKIWRCSSSGELEITEHDKTEFYFF